MADINEDLLKEKKEKNDQNIGYLDIRPNLKGILTKLQENTVVHKESEWAGQIKENWPYLIKHEFGLPSR